MDVKSISPGLEGMVPRIEEWELPALPGAWLSLLPAWTLQTVPEQTWRAAPGFQGTQALWIGILSPGLTCHCLGQR